MNNYKSALDKIKASESFKDSTITLLSDASQANKPKHRLTGIASVIAACLAIIMGITILMNPFSLGNTHNFTITASAADISATVNENDFTPISDISAAQVGLIGIDLSDINPMFESEDASTDTPHISNKAFFSLNVEGNDIEKIHFELNNGYFEVEQEIVNKIIDGSEKLPEPPENMQRGFEYYDTIMLDYSNQIDPIGKHHNGDWITMNVLHLYNEDTDKELLTNLLNLSVFKPESVHEFEEESYFESVFEDYLNEMYKDTEIHVTCFFEDGKSLTKTLKLYADCEILGTTEAYYFTGDDYAVENDADMYKQYEVYDYTVKLCAKIVS